jgi:glycosyltransferase involved in cell wall biosynthesis
MPIISTAITLKDLPPPPEGKQSWPWTEQIESLPERMQDGSEWPRISIVTPSYNYGEFIEETIRSILLQGYPNLEYIIIDGGSTDNTVEIIENYEQYLAYWVSEPDEGQADAINKGFQKSTGEIVAFLNSDDVYLPDALKFVANFLVERSEYDFVCGQTSFIDADSKTTKGFEELFMVEINHKTMTEECHIAQPSTFFRSKVFQQIGFLNQELHYCFDYEYWLRAYLVDFKFASSKEVISLFRLHHSSKTTSAYNQGKFTQDFIQIYRSTLSNKSVRSIYRKGVYRGLAKAACLLFVNLESSSTINDARYSFLKIIWQNPNILRFWFVWKTIVLVTTPVSLRKLWRNFKNK